MRVKNIRFHTMNIRLKFLLIQLIVYKICKAFSMYNTKSVANENCSNAYSTGTCSNKLQKKTCSFNTDTSQ